MSSLPNNELVVGLDAGGTYTGLCARAGAESDEIHLRGPAANAQRHGVAHTATVIASLVLQAHAQRPHAILRSVFAGVAGAGRTDIRKALITRLRAELVKHSECHINVAHDGIIALEGALDGCSGLLAIAGTGSAIIARTLEGNAVLAGGWGASIGDEGSGHAIGQGGLAAVTHAMDGGPATLLTELFSSRYQLSSRQHVLEYIYDRGQPLQQLAPLVIQAAEQEDQVATNILNLQCEALARRASWLLNRNPDIAPRYTVCGGLSHAPHFVEGLREHLATLWPEAEWQPPVHSALEGAVRLALKTLSDSVAD